MLNVIIVDDEPSVRDALRKLIDWRAHGFAVCGEAHNGQRAMELLRNNKVDVVITDIKMPVMDGLALIQAARAINHELAFVVLSAYDDFPLVKRAFKLGVSDYVLKTELNGDELAAILENLRANRDWSVTARRMRSEYAAEYGKIQNLIDENKILLQETALKELVLEGAEWDKARLEGLAPLGFHFYDGPLRIAVVKVLDVKNLHREAPGEEKIQFQRIVLHTISGFLESEGNGNSFALSPDEYVVLCNEKRESLPTRTPSLSASALALLSIISEHLEHALGMKIIAGVSNIASGCHECRKAYSQARQALKYHFIHGNGGIIRYGCLKDPVDAKPLDLPSRLEAFHRLIADRNAAAILNAKSSLSIRKTQLRLADIDAAKELYEQYHEILRKYADSSDYVRMSRLDAMLQRYEQRLRDSGCLADLNGWLKRALDELAAVMLGRGTLVSKVISYIHKNFAQSLHLADMAAEFGVNESYLSGCFSREMGQTLTSYIQKIRIETAADLIHHTNLKVYEIAEQVGYNCVEHFSRSFKKLMGVCPKHYIG